MFYCKAGGTLPNFKINVIMMLRGEGVRAMHDANFGMNYFE